MVLKVLCWLFALAAVAVGAWAGRVVPFAEQWPMFEALRTTAAIIFAVVGAWMAIIYPERLKLSFKPAATLTEDRSATGWGQLFTPVVHSTAILSVILVLGAAAPILKRMTLPIEVEVLRGCSYGLLIALTLWQLWTVLLTLIPADKVKTYLDHQDSRQAAVDALKTTAIKGPRDPA